MPKCAIALVPDLKSYVVLAEDEWNATKVMSTWIRSIPILIAPSQDEKIPKLCLLGLYKLLNYDMSRS